MTFVGHHQRDEVGAREEGMGRLAGAVDSELIFVRNRWRTR
jgi:hypothetical protein